MVASASERTAVRVGASTLGTLVGEGLFAWRLRARSRERNERLANGCCQPAAGAQREGGGESRAAATEGSHEWPVGRCRRVHQITLKELAAERALLR